MAEIQEFKTVQDQLNMEQDLKSQENKVCIEKVEHLNAMEKIQTMTKIKELSNNANLVKGFTRQLEGMEKDFEKKYESLNDANEGRIYVLRDALEETLEKLRK